jgi:hypothetical protein
MKNSQTFADFSSLYQKNRSQKSSFHVSSKPGEQIETNPNIAILPKILSKNDLTRISPT